MNNEIERVFIIGLDGAGNFIKDTDTPNIHKLLGKGVLTYSALASYPSISAECWGSILHGVLPKKHGLNNEKVSSKPYPENSSYPSLFKIAKKHCSNWKLASFCEWQPINDGIIELSSLDHSISDEDEKLAEKAATFIRNNHDIKAMFIEFSTPDASGHQFGYGTKQYLNDITKTDGYVGVVLEAIEDSDLLKDSLIIITSDHGGGGENLYSHGSDHSKDMDVFWGCHGPGINPQALLKDINNMDTAAIVLHALGLSLPEWFDAKVPKELFLDI